MVLAFDGQAFCRNFDSIDRVLRILVRAALDAGWEFEIWTQGELRPDAAQFKPWVRPIENASQSKASVLWTPDMQVQSADIPVIGTFHDVNPLLPDGRSLPARWLREQKFRRKIRNSLKLVERLATDTNDAKQRISKAFPETAPLLSVVPLFVDPDIKPISGEQAATLLAKLNIPSESILAVGSLRRHKNWTGLIKAYAQLPPATREKHHLVFAGPAKRARQEAQQLSESLGVENRVHVLGMVDDETLHALYGSAHLLVCPSFLEGFGFPPLEAMACGLPVVATNRTCVPEVLGNAAVYVDPSSTESIADGMISVIDNAPKRASLIEAGRLRAAEYNPERTAKAMLEIINQLKTKS